MTLVSVALGTAVAAERQSNRKWSTNWSAKRQKIEFKLLRITPTERKECVGFYRFKNLTNEPIKTPHLTFRSDGAAMPSEFTFEILRDGKWKNPGYFTDAVPLPSKIEAGGEVTLRVDVPVHLWSPDTTFRAVFGSFTSESATVKNAQRK